MEEYPLVLWDRNQPRGGRGRGRGGFRGGAPTCQLCNMRGHTARQCRNARPAAQATTTCGHCGQPGHGRRDHDGHPQGRCATCVSGPRAVSTTGQVLSTYVPDASPTGSQLRAFGRTYGTREGEQLSFVFTGTIRAHPATEAQRLPGSRAFTLAGMEAANLPVSFERYGRITFSSVSAVVMSEGAPTTTGSCWCAWVNTLAQGTAFTREWVRSRRFARRVMASNLSDVTFEADFGLPPTSNFSRRLKPVEAETKFPVFVWANHAAVDFTVRYSVTCLLREAVAEV